MYKIPKILQKADWYQKWGASGDIRPYVFVRPDNRIGQPGTRHRLNWFPMDPVIYNPLDLETLNFAEQIYFIEERAFGPSNMAMPRWVFYDCAVIPGFVGGFAMRNSALPEAVRQVMTRTTELEWTPLSLFIIIPTMAKGQWVAHNLCAINSLLPEQERFYGLGFLSKAFSLWYANVESCLGMTQWGNPALKLHSHYGPMEIFTAYTPVHSHAKTITYRVDVDTHCWEQFFTREPDLAFLEKYGPAGFQIDPKDEQSMISLQKKIESGSGPYYLSSADIASKKLTEALDVYRLKES
ncbi:MAG: hypothetical protein LW875_10720 [Proteobacteria bacterium]|jgi:hypothetical protein|nr:hypothetical protein [Pseudomonadota bacterium]